MPAFTGSKHGSTFFYLASVSFFLFVSSFRDNLGLG